MVGGAGVWQGGVARRPGRQRGGQPVVVVAGFVGGTGRPRVGPHKRGRRTRDFLNSLTGIPSFLEIFPNPSSDLRRCRRMNVT